MTIKDFARLCGCNAQTLRYYDRIDLLKPVRVDPWSGYRYYDPAQALDFVKIKNLQAADFSIEEIKALLTRPDQQVYEAFEQKIAEQEEKLERIREIQKSYLAEMNTMEDIIHAITDYLVGQCRDPEVLREFGLDPADAPAVLERVRTFLNRGIAVNIPQEDVTLTINDEVIQGADAVLQRVQSLTEEDLTRDILLSDSTEPPCDEFDPAHWDTLWERHDWEHMRDFMDDIPPLEEGSEYCFWLHLQGELYRDDLSFGLFLLGAMLTRCNGAVVPMNVSVNRSEDAENHFRLLRKKPH